MATWKQPAEYNRLHVVNGKRLEQDIADFEAAWDEVQDRKVERAMQLARWKRLAVWGACILGCAVAWAAIIYGVLALGDWLAVR